MGGAVGQGSGPAVGNGIQEAPPPNARGGTGVQASPHESRPEGEDVPFSTGQRQGADLRPTISPGPPRAPLFSSGLHLPILFFHPLALKGRL